MIIVTNFFIIILGSHHLGGTRKHSHRNTQSCVGLVTQRDEKRIPISVRIDIWKRMERRKDMVSTRRSRKGSNRNDFM